MTPMSRKDIIVTRDALRHYIGHLEACIRYNTFLRSTSALTAQLNAARAVLDNLKR